MKNVKDQIISLIKEMPESITMEEILDSIYVQQKVLKAQKDVREGKSFTQSEAKNIAEKWKK
ncbi:MAG: hypothetical protein ABIT08_11655 [Bacteroidia bacterium]